MRWYCIVLMLLVSQNSFGYRIFYAEQWYELYHQHLNRYPEDEYQNLIYLEEALKSPFSNPLYALAKIETEQDWEQYRNLFKLHTHLQIVRTYLQLAVKYDKEKVYFYNEPWRDANLASLEIAEKYYKRALYFWTESQQWVEKANNNRLRWIELNEISAWKSELSDINQGNLNFELIIKGYLAKLEKNREAFKAMPASLPN